MSVSCRHGVVEGRERSVVEKETLGVDVDGGRPPEGLLEKRVGTTAVCAHSGGVLVTSKRRGAWPYVCSSTWFSTLMREGVETAPVLGNPMWALVRHSLQASTCSVSLIRALRSEELKQPMSCRTFDVRHVLYVAGRPVMMLATPPTRTDVPHLHLPTRGESTTCPTWSQRDEDEAHSMLYKTELCRSFAETGECRYGHKCQVATIPKTHCACVRKPLSEGGPES
jgi:hypothetical protein